MRKTILITFLIFIFFIIECMLFEVFGRLFTPDLLLLLVVFITLGFGVRYGLFAAILAGFMQDSFGTGIFGIHVFALILCVYLTPFIKKHLYYASRETTRIILVFLLVTLNVSVHLIGQLVFHAVDFPNVIQFIYVPQVITTLLVTAFTFEQLKVCVSKFCV